jgi:hypothetical protein
VHLYKQQSNLSGAREFINERLSNEVSVITMAFDDGDAIGFVQIYPSFSSVSMKRKWVLNDQYVKINGRSKGFGEELLRAAIAFAVETDAKESHI